MEDTLISMTPVALGAVLDGWHQAAAAAAASCFARLWAMRRSEPTRVGAYLRIRLAAEGRRRSASTIRLRRFARRRRRPRRDEASISSFAKRRNSCGNTHRGVSEVALIGLRLGAASRWSGARGQRR